MAYNYKYFESSQVFKQCQAKNNFGKTLTNIAEYWAMQDLRESGINRGSGIDEMNKSYNKGFGEAYCVISQWFFFEELAKLTNTQNMFPAYQQTYGRASLTRDILTKQGFVTSEIRAGNVFYRKSSESGSSGHFGIVIAVSLSNERQGFFTVEGNVKIDSENKEGIGVAFYPYNDVPASVDSYYNQETEETEYIDVPAIEGYQKWDFVFFDLTNQIELNKVYEYNGYDCTKIVSGSDISYQSENMVINGKKVTTKLIKDFSLTDTKTIEEVETEIKENIESINQSTNTEETRKICNEVVMKIPNSDSLLHWSVMNNSPAVVSDIIGKNILGVSDGEANGSALGFLNDNTSGFGKSGFAMFVNSKGNPIFIFDENSEKAIDLVKGGFVGSLATNEALTQSRQNITKASESTLKEDCFMIVLNYGYESDWKGEFGKKLVDMTNGWVAVSNFHSIIPEQKIGNSTFSGRKFFDALKNENNFTEYRNDPSIIGHVNLLGLFKKLDSLDFTQNQIPIVVTLRKVNENALLKSLKNILDMVEVVASMLPILNEFTPYIKSLSDFVDNEYSTFKQTGKYQININDVVKIAELAGKAIELLAPESAKSVKTIANELISSAKDISKSVTEYYKGKTGWATQYVQDSLGITWNNVDQIYNHFVSGVNPDLRNVYQKIVDSDTLKIYSQRINSVTNMQLSRAISKWIGSGYAQMDTVLKGMNSPILNSFFVNMAGDGIVGGLNGAKELFGLSYKTGEIAKTLTEKYGFMKSAYGLPVSKENYKDLIIESLVNKANSQLGDIYIVPPNIPKDQAMCYKFEIESQKATNKKVVVCQDGYEYNPTTNECTKTTVTVKKDFNFSGQDVGNTKIVTNDENSSFGNDTQNQKKNEDSGNSRFDGSTDSFGSSTNLTKEEEIIGKYNNVKLPPCFKLIENTIYYDIRYLSGELDSTSKMVENSTFVNGGGASNLKMVETIKPTDDLVSLMKLNNGNIQSYSPQNNLVPTTMQGNVKVPALNITPVSKFALSEDMSYLVQGGMSNTGTSSERYFALINNQWEEIKDCVVYRENNLQKQNCPDGYVWNENTAKCELKKKITIVPDVPKFEYPNEPVKPYEPVDSFVPDKPTDPVKPYEPVDSFVPNKPTDPVKPYEPVDSFVPDKPTDPIKPYVPELPPVVTKCPDGLVYNSETGNCEYTPPVKPYVPEVPPPSDNSNCGCELDKPKMVEEYKKVYYQFPRFMENTDCEEEEC